MGVEVPGQLEILVAGSGEHCPVLPLIVVVVALVVVGVVND